MLPDDVHTDTLQHLQRVLRAELRELYDPPNERPRLLARLSHLSFHQLAELVASASLWDSTTLAQTEALLTSVDGMPWDVGLSSCPCRQQHCSPPTRSRWARKVRHLPRLPRRPACSASAIHQRRWLPRVSRRRAAGRPACDDPLERGGGRRRAPHHRIDLFSPRCGAHSPVRGALAGRPPRQAASPASRTGGRSTPDRPPGARSDPSCPRCGLSRR